MTLNAIKTDFDKYNSSYSSLATKLKQKLNPVEKLKIGFNGIINSIIDPKEGLIAQFNCRFLRKEILLVNESLCVKLIPAISNMSIILLGMSLVLILGQYCQCCIHRNISGKTKENIREHQYQSGKLSNRIQRTSRKKK